MGDREREREKEKEQKERESERENERKRERAVEIMAEIESQKRKDIIKQTITVFSYSDDLTFRTHQLTRSGLHTTPGGQQDDLGSRSTAVPPSRRNPSHLLQ